MCLSALYIRYGRCMAYLPGFEIIHVVYHIHTCLHVRVCKIVHCVYMHIHTSCKFLVHVGTCVVLTWFATSYQQQAAPTVMFTRSVALHALKHVTIMKRHLFVLSHVLLAVTAPRGQ